MSGLNRYTANVLNPMVPKVRILPLPQTWLVSSVGSEHDATNVGVGSSNLSRVTYKEVGRSRLAVPVLRTDRR